MNKCCCTYQLRYQITQVTQVSYFQGLFHVKTVDVPGFMHWKTLHLSILDDCIFNKKISVSDNEELILPIGQHKS